MAGASSQTGALSTSASGSSALGANDEASGGADRHDETLDGRGARARLTEAEEYALKGKAA